MDDFSVEARKEIEMWLKCISSGDNNGVIV